ncbi:MAG: hypothetical protein PWQ09_347 [Candidatus Cloacimonadota bacterium]|jgi:aspartyl aminopeptidase|nr:hypothetical protein [Candidatus Cloacimonadota bacterium]
MKKAKELQEKLGYKRKNFWKEFPKETEAAFDFCEDYKKFLSTCKTVRETITYFTKILSQKKFTNLDENDAKGKKVFRIARNKNAAMAIIGKQPVSTGVNLVVSHIDAPRVDLKQNPLYEDNTTNLGIMRTHYYGGIKKYQWMSTPLSLHGVVITKEGETVNISIGENEDDPVFVMPDLLPHLARKVQYSKKIGEAVDASKMNLIFSSMPYIDDDEDIKEAVKLQTLVLLNEKYDITEADFLSAELEIVPAGKSRDAGLDKSMVLGYGQDDRSCAYTSAEALFEVEHPEKTAIVYLADKEEIGSEGNTGAKSIFILDFISDLLKHNQEDFSSANLRKTLIKSQILSADVNAAINPNYPSVHEKENAVHLGQGVSITKFTGSGGKSGSNDANAEFNHKIMRIFNEENVNWQIGSLGKVDEGGGGTIAKFMAQHGAEVIDCGPGVLGMHSLYELTSKADIYSAYKGYKAFFKKG